MKRGVFRIIIGIVMILLQGLAVLGQASAGEGIPANPWFYAVGIIGIFLLIFGIRIYKKGIRSELVLHTGGTALNTAINWISLAVSALLFVICVGGCILTGVIDIFSFTFIFMIPACLCFAMYLLFYISEKPCCLFSATLIFIAVAYLYTTFLSLLSIDGYSTTDYLVNIFLHDIPKLLAAVLYILIATQLYTEFFSVKVVRILGWIAFGLECICRVIYSLVTLRFINIVGLEGPVSLLFVAALFLYISIFEIRTFKASSSQQIRCPVRFCRKCGKPLTEHTPYCLACNTYIIEEENQ